jgi:hypothetical protein
MSLNQNEKTVTLESDFTGFKLSPEVQELMTVGGNLSPMDGHISLRFVDGVTETLSGFLKLDHGVVNDVRLEKMKFEFSGGNTVVSGKVQAQTLEWPSSHGDFLPKIFPENAEKLQVKMINGQFTRTPDTINVTGLQGAISDPKVRFSFDGGWNEDSTLYGSLQLKGDRKNQIFDLRGTRQVPLWDLRKAK